MKTRTGFTLIEFICVIAVMSIGLVGISRLFQQTREGPLYAAAVQNATQLAQECAEVLLDSRRSGSYASPTSASCNALTLPVGYSRTLSASTTANSACPSGAACTWWKVLVTAPAESTTVTTSAVVMLVQY